MEPEVSPPIDVAPSTSSPRPTAPPAQPFNVIKEETFTVRTMKVQDAVMQLNLLGSEFLVFSDADNQGISVVYRRNDGQYGLIQTGRESGGA
jgi:putative sigma-54 modulation protein